MELTFEKKLKIKSYNIINLTRIKYLFNNNFFITNISDDVTVFN